MNRQETITYLGLDKLEPTEETSNKSVYSLNQNMYAKVFTLLDRNESDWNEDSEELDNSNEDELCSTYFSKTGELKLEADLEKDQYKITITDKESE